MPVYWVAVLGDFGRSPRMQYHALSLSEIPGNDVHIIAYDGSPPLEQLQSAPNVTLHNIPKPPAWLDTLPAAPRLALKALQQLLALLFVTLLLAPRPRAILLQTPPALPTMLAFYLAAAVCRATLVFDWHNLAFSLMALSLPPAHPLLHIATAYERRCARLAHRHLCVTRAMQRWLRDHWRVDATVFYDCAPDIFRPISPQEAHDLLLRLHAEGSLDADHPDYLAAGALAACRPPETTVLTAAAEGGVGRAVMRSERPAVVVSGTSWTPDEDFGILLEAAQRYDEAAAADPALPPVLFLVTGKGPQKELYAARLRSLQLRRAAFRLLWLHSRDYPLLLAAADLGVSLHTSSSGLDLPMKVVDMYGAGLPVLSVRYPCIGELVQEGVTGLLFDDAAGLAARLEEVLWGWHGGEGEEGAALGRLREGVRQGERVTWRAQWCEVVQPLVEGA